MLQEESRENVCGVIAVCDSRRAVKAAANRSKGEKENADDSSNEGQSEKENADETADEGQSEKENADETADEGEKEGAGEA